MKKWSFQAKLVAAFMLVITVVLVAVFWSASLFIRDRMLNEKQQDLTQKGSELAKKIAAFKENPTPKTTLGDLLSDMDLYLDSRIWVLDANRQPLAFSQGSQGGSPRGGMGMGMGRGGGQGGGMGMGGRNVLPGGSAPLPGALPAALRSFANELDTVYQGNLWSKVIVHPVYEEQMVVVGVPIRLSSGKVDGAVVINSPVVAVNDFLRNIYWFIGLGALAGILLSFLIVQLLTRSLVRPLRAMQDTTGAIAKGEYGARVEIDSTDEIGRLGTSINQLAVDLGQFMLDAAKTEKLRRDFIANVSHELRTPLTIIRGYSEAILDGTVDDPKQIESFLQMVRDEAVRLERLIKSLLELSKLQTAESGHNFVSLDLAEILRHVGQLMQPLAAAKQIALRVEPGETLPKISGDRDRLVQLLLILADNAVKYTPAGGSVTLSLAQTEAGALRCTVQDTGIGIPAEDLPYIWERFYKVDKSHQQDEGSAGLGLAIARQIIDLHKARVNVVSELGSGTRFELEFTSFPL
jgi:signal transduction histidine kinase